MENHHMPAPAPNNKQTRTLILMITVAVACVLIGTYAASLFFKNEKFDKAQETTLRELTLTRTLVVGASEKVDKTTLGLEKHTDALHAIAKAVPSTADLQSHEGRMITAIKSGDKTLYDRIGDVEGKVVVVGDKILRQGYDNKSSLDALNTSLEGVGSNTLAVLNTQDIHGRSLKAIINQGESLSEAQKAQLKEIAGLTGGNKELLAMLKKLESKPVVSVTNVVNNTTTIVTNVQNTELLALLKKIESRPAVIVTNMTTTLWQTNIAKAPEAKVEPAKATNAPPVAAKAAPTPPAPTNSVARAQAPKQAAPKAEAKSAPKAPTPTAKTAAPTPPVKKAEVKPLPQAPTQAEVEQMSVTNEFVVVIHADYGSRLNLANVLKKSEAGSKRQVKLVLDFVAKKADKATLVKNASVILGNFAYEYQADFAEDYSWRDAKCDKARLQKMFGEYLSSTEELIKHTANLTEYGKASISYDTKVVADKLASK